MHLLHYRILEIFLLILALFIAGIFSFAETATVAVSQYRLSSLKDKHYWAFCAYQLKLQINKVLIFSLFGNSLFNAIFTTFATLMAEDVLLNVKSKALALPIITLLVALIIIVFSEAVPKVISARMPLWVCKILAIPLYYLFRICKPIIWVIDGLIMGITAIFTPTSHERTSMEEIKAIIADESSPLKDKHRSILLNSMELEDICIREILIPLRMIEAIDINADMDEVAHQLFTTHHTRVIVYNEVIDNILGFIHVKDLLAIENKHVTKNLINRLLRPITYAYDFIPVMWQINRAQKYKSRIFVVINEYGDILGIACLEDMLEIIFGNFTTESPSQKQLLIKTNANETIIDGTMLLRDIPELKLIKDKRKLQCITVNGLILKLFDGMPKPGLCFKIDKYIIEVLSLGDHWVERIKLKKIVD